MRNIDTLELIGAVAAVVAAVFLIGIMVHEPAQQLYVIENGKWLPVAGSAYQNKR